MSRTTTYWRSVTRSVDKAIVTKTIVDTSVVVPALLTGHQSHDLARRFVDADAPSIAGHALVESFSVLTRLPGLRLAAEDALRLLSSSFPDVCALDEPKHHQVVRVLAEAGVEGGAVYDGLVGLAAKAAERELVTMDARASSTYRRLGVRFRLLTGDDRGGT